MTEGTGPATSALDDVEVWVMFVSQPTQDNYVQVARDQAAVRGVEPVAVLREMAEQWRKMHERQPLDGYDHLAAWAEQHDPTVGGPPSGLQVLQARALESARRDPYQAVIGDQALVQEAIASQRAQDDAAAAATGAPSVDPASGMLPGAGPLPVPDVPVGPDADQRAADQSTPADTPPSSPTPPADQPTPTPPPKRNGGSSGSASGDTPPSSGTPTG